MNARMLHRPAIKLGVTTSVVAVALLAGASLVGDSTAANPFQAGQVSADLLELPAAARSALASRADTDLRGLGLARGAGRSLQRLQDRFENATYDEVTELDAKGQPTAILRYGANGAIHSAVALGWRGTKGRAIGSSVAAARGKALAAAIGASGGEPVVEPLLDGTGWRAWWPRTVDGVAVPGDGLRIDIWSDGSLHSLVRSERALGARPSQPIDDARAQALARDVLTKAYADRAGELSIEGSALAWVAPNDAFDPTLPDAPASTLRLARVVRVVATGSVAQQVERLEIYVDAGDGTVLGGDVLE